MPLPLVFGMAVWVELGGRGVAVQRGAWVIGLERGLMGVSPEVELQVGHVQERVVCGLASQHAEGSRAKNVHRPLLHMTGLCNHTGKGPSARARLGPHRTALPCRPSPQARPTPRRLAMPIIGHRRCSKQGPPHHVC